MGEGPLEVALLFAGAADLLGVEACAMFELGRMSDPTVFVLYGVTGDLARRMVLPAFFRLAQAELLPHDWRLIGNGRGDVSHDDFRVLVHDALTEFGPQPDEGLWEGFCSRLRFAGDGFSPKSSWGPVEADRLAEPIGWLLRP